MSKTLNPSEYNARLEILQKRTVFTHRSPDSFASAIHLGSHHPVFNFRISFGMPYTYSFIDPQGNIHRCPGVYAPVDQEIIQKARKQNKLNEAIGRIGVQGPTCDALLVHAPIPGPDLRVSKGLADYHIRAWRQDVLQTHNINPIGGVLLYMRRDNLTAVDYRTGDVHVITVLPGWAGHTVQSATEGFSPAIPQVEVEQMALRVI